MLSFIFRNNNIYLLFLLLCSVPISTLANEDWVKSIDDIPLEKLNTIITSVSKKPEPFFQAPAAVFVISNDDIKQSGATNIPELLRMVPGLQVTRTESKTWAITSRGFNDGFGNKLLVLIDGRSVYTPLFSGVYWDVQDTLLEDIDRIEVIRGPGATLWGANAVNGVINIITKNSKETHGSFVKFGLGNEERSLVEARYGNKISEKLHYRAYTKFNDRDESDTLTNTEQGSNWNKSQAGIRIDWDKDHKNQFSFFGDVYYGEEDLDIIVPTLSSPFGELRNDDLEIFGANIISKWFHTFDNGGKGTLKTYFDRAQRLYSVLDQTNDTFEIEWQHSKKINKTHDFIWGLGYRYIQDDLDGTIHISWVPDDRSRHLYTGFFQDKVTLIDNKLYLTIGSKFEHNSFTGYEVQPSARIGWYPTSSQTVWGSIARAVRTPNRSEDDISFVVASLNPGYIRWIGNREYKSEELTAYEIGYRIKPNNKFILDTSLFYNVYDNLRTNELDFSSSSGLDPALALPFANEAEAKTYGFEISADYKIRRNWVVKGSYSYLHMDIDKKPNSTDSRVEGDEKRSPSHQFNLISNIFLPYDLQFTNLLYYVDSLKLNSSTNIDIPAYYRLDTKITWTPNPNWEFSLIGQNLLDDKHVEFNSALYSQQAQIERSIYGTITWRF